MSVQSVIGGSARGLLIAAATAVAAFGLLVVFHPFGGTAPGALTVATTAPGSDDLQARIAALRTGLAETEAALDKVNTAPVPPAPVADNATRAQYEAQIAAATERRDLALRHAQAIRDGLKAGLAVSSLAEIRDSVVIGQLIAQQTALESQIAEQGARFKASHPVMLALIAQRSALAAQIKQEAASIAAALESEAKLDDAQIALLQSQLTPLPTTTAAIAAAPDTAGLEAKAAAERAELDGLMDAYFNLKPATATATTTLPAAASPLSLANLFVVGVAGIAAIVFQLYLATRRRKLKRAEADLAGWKTDHDPEIVVTDVPVSEPAMTEEAPPLRKAS